MAQSSSKRRKLRAGFFASRSIEDAFNSAEWQTYLKSFRSVPQITVKSSEEADREAPDCGGMFLSDEIDVEAETFQDACDEDSIVDVDLDPGPVRPGIVLEALLQFANLDPIQAARRLKTTVEYLQRVSDGRSRVTPRLSQRVSEEFGVRSDFLRNLQERYEEHLAKESNAPSPHLS